MLIGRRKIFQGRVITVNVETVELPGGRRTDLEIVHHPGGAAIVAIDAQRRVCLLRQFRHAAGGWVWELPAGKLEPDEPPLLTAQRELVEEAGMRAATWRSLGSHLSSPGVFTEVVHLYLATGLESVPSAAGDDEIFEVHWISLDEACRSALEGELRDAKSIVGLLRGRHVLEEGRSVTDSTAMPDRPA